MHERCELAPQGSLVDSRMPLSEEDRVGILRTGCVGSVEGLRIGAVWAPDEEGSTGGNPVESPLSPQQRSVPIDWRAKAPWGT